MWQQCLKLLLLHVELLLPTSRESWDSSGGSGICVLCDPLDVLEVGVWCAWRQELRWVGCRRDGTAGWVGVREQLLGGLTKLCAGTKGEQAAQFRLHT